MNDIQMSMRPCALNEYSQVELVIIGRVQGATSITKHGILANYNTFSIKHSLYISYFELPISLLP